MTYKGLGVLLSAYLLFALLVWAIAHYDLNESVAEAARISLITTLLTGLVSTFLIGTLRPLFAAVFPTVAIGFAIALSHKQYPLTAVAGFIVFLIISTAGLADAISLDAKRVALMSVSGTCGLTIAFLALLIGQPLYDLAVGTIGILITYLIGHVLDRHGQGKTGC